MAVNTPGAGDVSQAAAQEPLPRETARRAPWRLGRPLGWILFALYLLLLLFVLECAAGFAYDRMPKAYGKRNIELLLGNVDATKLFNERPHPYMLWENTPGYVAENGFRQVNAQGYRNEADITPLPPANTVRILTLGGSTTYGYLQDRPADAWPSQLEALLNARGGAGGRDSSRYEVVNGGLNYGTTAELVAHYLVRERYLQPAVVIIHTAGNDGLPLLYNDYNPEYTHFRPGWGAASHSLRRGERPLITYSNLMKLWYAFWLRDRPAAAFVNKQSRSLDLDQGYYLRNARQNEPAGFERNLDLLVRNVIMDGATPVLFPELLISESQWDGMSPAAAKNAAYTRSVMKGWRVALDKNVQAMRTIAARYNVPIIELPADSLATEYFLDHMHLTRDGDAVKARAVARGLEAHFRNTRGQGRTPVVPSRQPR